MSEGRPTAVYPVRANLGAPINDKRPVAFAK